MFYIYKIINKLNNKIYVGITSKGEKRWQQHLAISKSGPDKNKSTYSYIHKAINKYGCENFEFIIFDSFATKEQACQAEIFGLNFLKKIM